MKFEFNQNNFFNELHIDSPKEFVKYVSLDSSIKSIIFGAQYIFRGVSDASYELIPSARREGVELNYLSFPSEANAFSDGTLVGQIAKEYLILKKFYEIADKAGLKVPDAPLLRKTIRNKIGHSAALDQWSIWPSEEIEPVCALAQHYGLPTCMIDWTYLFNIALYFAVIGSVANFQEHIDNNKNFSIYALDTKVLDKLKLRIICKWPIELVHPAYHTNPNLSAQKGLLSFWRERIPEYTRSIVHENHLVSNVIIRSDGFNDECFSETPLNRKYADFITNLKLDGELLELAQSLFYKLTFSYSCLGKAILHLSITNANSSALFPGFAGIVKHMRDNALVCKQALKIFNLPDVLSLDGEPL